MKYLYLWWVLHWLTYWLSWNHCIHPPANTPVMLHSVTPLKVFNVARYKQHQHPISPFVNQYKTNSIQLPWQPHVIHQDIINAKGNGHHLAGLRQMGRFWVEQLKIARRRIHYSLSSLLCFIQERFSPPSHYKWCITIWRKFWFWWKNTK